MKSTGRFILVFILAVVAILGCEQPVSSGRISGVVRNVYTGAPIQYATVMVGNDSMLTGTDGAFSFTISPGGMVTTSIYVYRGISYTFWGVSGVSIDTSQNPAYSIYLIPMPLGGAPASVTVSGNLTPASTSDQASITVTATNGTGGITSASQYLANTDTAYSVDLQSIGSNCFVAITYDADGTGTTYTEYRSGVDLTADVTFNMSAAPATEAVSVTGTAGEMLVADLDLSPVDSISYYQTTLASSPQTVSIYNPDDIPVIWKTATREDDVPAAGYTTLRAHIAPSQPFSTAVTLSSAASIPSPTTVVEDETWNASTRTLSFTGGTGSTMTMCQFASNMGFQGFIFTDDEAIVIPLDFYADILTQAGSWSVKFIPIYSSRDLSNYVDMRMSAGGPVDVEDAQMSYVVSYTNDDVVANLIIP